VNALGVLARAALYAYPSDFRAHYADQILADIAHDGAHPAALLFDLLRGGIAMRFEGFLRNASYALRRLRAAPLFVAIVILTFALGIGANVAVFSVLNGVVLRPLPFPNASGLVIVQAHDPRGHTFPAISVTDASDLRTQTHTIAAIAAVSDDQGTLLVGGRPVSLYGLDVMPEYSTILGIKPELGRALEPSDGRPGVHNIVISYQIWQKYFALRPSTLGSTLSLDGQSFRIVGILRRNQTLADPSQGSIGHGDFLKALPETGTARSRGARFLGAVARLSPGVSLANANAEFKLISNRLQRLYPDTDAHWTFSLVSFVGTVLGSAASSLWIIFAAVVGVLLIACANIGNMLAARWSSRDRELAIRRALGASSRAIAGQLFIETGVLAFIGAIIGIVLAFAALHVLSGLMSTALPRASSVRIDAVSLLYAMGAVIIATFLAGLSPLLSLRANDLHSVLKSAGRGGDGSRRHRMRAVLVVLEVALALSLVIVSGLMLRGFVALVHTPLGIRPEGVVVTESVAVPQQYGSPAARATMQRALLRRLRVLPGVEAASLALSYPLGDTRIGGSIDVFGRTYPNGGAPFAWTNDVSPEYFRALGIPLVRGRAFTASDATGSAPVAIVNQAFVARILKGTDSLQARIRLQGPGSAGAWAAIVGVVANERDSLTSAPEPEVYTPAAQASPPYLSSVVYAPRVDVAVAGREVQGAFARTMPLVQPPATYTMPQLVAIATAQARFAAILLGLLALIALLLALSGIFGVVSFSVTQRVREFGVRTALGATARDIVIDVLRRAFVTTATGVALGLVLAAIAARAIASQLGSISPFDPATFATVVVLVFLCTALASLQPAMRATRVQPAEALRYE